MASLTIRNLSATPLELALVERFDSALGVVNSSSSSISNSTSSASNSNRPSGGGGAKSSLWGVFRSPFGGSTYVDDGHVKLKDGNEKDGTGSSNDIATTAAANGSIPGQEGHGVTVAPFETRKTKVRAPEAGGREAVRLTIYAAEVAEIAEAAGTAYHRDHRGQHDPRRPQAPTIRYRYTVEFTAATPAHSIELRAVQAEGAEIAVTTATTAPPRLLALFFAHSAHLVVLPDISLASWMAHVDGAWPLSSLSLPGTHNSPACYVALPSVRCQAVDVATQLENGARFLDVRVGVSVGGGAGRPNGTPNGAPNGATAGSLPGTNHPDGTLPPSARHPHAPPPADFPLVHSAFSVSLKATHWFSELYAALCGFLDTHPTETVLLSLKREGTGQGTDADLARQLFENYLLDGIGDGGSPRWFTEARIPTLDEVRGRIVLVRRFRLSAGKEGSSAKAGAASAPSAVAAAATSAASSGPSGWGLDASVWPDNCVNGVVGSGHLRLQDFYHITHTQYIERKIGYACAQFERAASQCFTRCGGAATALAQPPPLTLNFLSGSHLFRSSCWPERIAARVNPAVLEYLCTRHGEAAAVGQRQTSTGLVVMDWVGVDGDWDLIKCIVAWNARLALSS